MQEHADDIHSRPAPRCPSCNAAIAKTTEVCPKCGARVDMGEQFPDEARLSNPSEEQS